MESFVENLIEILEKSESENKIFEKVKVNSYSNKSEKENQLGGEGLILRKLKKINEKFYFLGKISIEFLLAKYNTHQ